MLMAALPSCHDGREDEPEMPADEAATMSIGFKVSAPSTTRAGDVSGTGVKEGYEPGEYLESVIDFASDNYRVYFFDNENKYLCEWDRVAEVHVLKTTDYWIYTFTGRAPEALETYNEGNKNFSVMVLANWPNYPDRDNMEGKTISDFVTAEWAKFSAFDSFELSLEENRLIPLYGLGKYTDVTLIKGSTCDLKTLNLLRAMAKVEVNLSGLPEDVTLEENPVIRGINPGGYCAPEGEFGTGSNWNTDYVTDLHLPFEDNQNHTDAKDGSAEMLRVGEEDKWIAYLPEFRNIGQDVFSRIELKLSYRDEPFVLHFARYDEDGRPDNENGRFDIRRNDLYRYNVRGDLHTIKFKLEVEEWTEGGRTEIDM